METEDLTQPVSESYLHLSQDIDDISDTSVRIKDFDTNHLMELVDKFDNQITDDSDDDTNDIKSLKRGFLSTSKHSNKRNNDEINNDNDHNDEHDNDHIQLKGTGVKKGNTNGKTNDNNDKNETFINDDTEIDLIVDNEKMISSHSTPIINKVGGITPKLTVDELARLMQPLLKEEFKDFKESIKHLITESISHEDKSNEDINKLPRHRQQEMNRGPIPHGVQATNDDKSNDSDSDNDIIDHKFEDSPITTPPHSSDQVDGNVPIFLHDVGPYSNNLPTSRTMSSSNDEEIKYLKSQIKNLNNFNQKLKLENSTLRNNNDLEHLKQLNNKLTIKLDESRNYNQELRNEINYLNQNSKMEISKLLKKIDQLQGEIGNESDLIMKHNINPNFRKYHDILNLSDIDNLTKVEMSNLIKNILLTLLMDYKHLPDNLSRFLKFVKLSNVFIDNVHEFIYDNNLRPSFYLKGKDHHDLINFEGCLNDMLTIIRQSMNK